jgi:hypothetical protein
MKNIVLLLLLFSSLYSKNIDELIDAFQNREFKLVCQEGMAKFSKGNRDEDFLGMVGVACAEVDYINPLAKLQRVLRSTKTGRNNASYFATLILQKKLFYQFMLDDIELGYLRVPDTNHILSVIFRNLVLNKYQVTSNSPKALEIVDSGRTIKISITDDNPQKVLVDIFKDGKKIAHHWYR